MRSAIIHLSLGVLLIGGAYAADTYLSTPNVTLYWWGAYIVGGIEIIQGIRAAVRAQKLKKMMGE